MNKVLSGMSMCLLTAIFSLSFFYDVSGGGRFYKFAVFCLSMAAILALNAIAWREK
jgi:hypothetical protein